MSKVISIHEYVLKPGVDEGQFEQAIREARARGLLQLPGLVDYYFVKGIRGARRKDYAAIWVYESRAAWEKLWGAPDQPRPKEAYPEKWQEWEEEVLAPFLDRDPDRVDLTAYQEW